MSTCTSVHIHFILYPVSRDVLWYHIVLRYPVLYHIMLSYFCFGCVSTPPPNGWAPLGPTRLSWNPFWGIGSRLAHKFQRFTSLCISCPHVEHSSWYNLHGYGKQFLVGTAPVHRRCTLAHNNRVCLLSVVVSMWTSSRNSLWTVGTADPHPSPSAPTVTEHVKGTKPIPFQDMP